MLSLSKYEGTAPPVATELFPQGHPTSRAARVHLNADKLL